MTVDDLMQEAVDREGVGDWGDDLTFRDTLELFVASCEETAALNALGSQVLERAVVRRLRNRLELGAYVEANPDTLSAAIERPLVVTGLPRTGTTMLHNLLALDPGHRVLRVWQALSPIAAATQPEAELVARARKWLERFYEMVPTFRTIHPITADGPEECDALLQNSFASLHFDDMFDARRYSAWRQHAELEREYAHYRLQLQVLSHSENGEGRTWLLKSPSHLGHLDTLLRTLPDAVVVYCHRDPRTAVASYASLMLALRRAYSDDVSPSVVGRQSLERCQLATERAMRARARCGAERFVEVSYRSLVDDPVAQTGHIMRSAGRSSHGTLDQAVASWRADNPQHSHGVHRYALEDFGLTSEEVDAAFASYLAEFGELAR